MDVHDYTAKEALDTLLRIIGKHDDELAHAIREAINAGIEDEGTEIVGKGSREKERKYRQTRPLTEEEALLKAVEVLEAHFIELPLFINSISENFDENAIDSLERVDSDDKNGRKKSKELPLFPNSAPANSEETPIERPAGTDSDEENLKKEGKTKPKQVQIEVQTETQISLEGQEIFQIEMIPPEQIQKQKENLAKLKRLISFVEE